MKYFYYFIYIFILACQSTPEDDEKITTNHIKIVRSYLSQCLYPQALFEIKKALSLDPDSYIINNVAGVVYFSMKQYDQAQAHFTKSIEGKPDYTEAQVNLAQTLIERKRYKKALSYLKNAEKDLTYINPSKVHSRIGEIYYYQKNYFLSKKYLMTAAQVDKKNCSAPYYLGRIHYDQGAYKPAIEQFNEMKVCQKDFVKIHSACQKPKIDHYYYQARSEIKIKQFRAAKKNLKLFVEKSNKDNPLLAEAKILLEGL